MATGRDTLRIVTLSAGGRPVQVLDLNDASGYWRDREAGFQFTPAAVSQQVSRRAQRYGGGRVVGEIHDNGAIGWTAYVRGSTVAECSQRVEALLSQVNDTARGKYVEWAPDTLSSSFLEIAGPGSWTPSYDPLMLSQSQAMKVQISFPVLPLVRWAPLTISDDFSVDSRTDYTFDASTSADVNVSGGVLVPVVGAAVTVERRARHTARGYDLLEGQATIKSRPDLGITSYKAGVTLRASAATTYVEVYVDDNGTNSRLRIDVVIAGVRTNRATTNLGARISLGNNFWVRGRIEGSVVTAEHFTAAPNPMDAPTTTTSYTLVVGDAPLNTTAGKSGWSWVPQNANALLDDFEFRPFTYRNQTLPQTLSPGDDIPGSAPALVDADITPSGGSFPPVWALLGWAKLAAADTSPFGLTEAEAAFSFSGGWASSVQAGARGGNDVRVTTSGAATYTARYVWVSPIMEADDFSDGVVTLEIWARALVTSTLVNPRLRASAGIYASSSVLGSRDTAEFGSTGRLLAKPSSGTVYRMTRLGSVIIDATTAAVSGTLPGIAVDITGTVEASSTGAFGFDYIMVTAARRRALGPTGVAASTVASFQPTGVGGTNQFTKRVRADLSATVQLPTFAPARDVGLGGSLLEPSAGRNRWLIKLSSAVPDDPTVDTTTENLAQSATVSLNVTPRSYLLRGS